MSDRNDAKDLSLLISPLHLHRQGQSSGDPNNDLLQVLLGSLRLSPLMPNDDSTDGVDALVKLLGRAVKQDEGDSHSEGQPGSDGAEAVSTAIEDALHTAGKKPEGADFEGTVERIRQQLAEQEQALQGEHTRLDQTIDSLSSNSSAHSEAIILCETGGRSAGRMLLHNPLGERVDVSFSCHLSADEPHSVDTNEMLEIVPPQLALDADQSAAVSVCVDLGGVELGQTRELNLRIEAMSGNKCLSICWLTVKVVEIL